MVSFTLFPGLIGRKGIEHMGVSSAQGDIRNYEPEHQTVTNYVPHLLGGSPTASARMLTESTRTTIEHVNDCWISVSFQRPEPDERIFTRRDIEVFTIRNGLVDPDTIDPATSCSLLRVNSHPADRLSLQQFEALVEDAIRRFGLDDTAARVHVINHMCNSVRALKEMLLHPWRHWVETPFVRLNEEIAQRGYEDSHMCFPLSHSFGFVDMVSYTSSPTIPGSTLVDLIERFREESCLTVMGAGGRIAKTIGDTVSYIADNLTTGMKVTTSLIECLSADDTVLPVRTPFMRGDVFSRSGDVFDPAINLVSRLADIVPVGKILTDPATAATIAADKAKDGYALEDFPSVELRGFGRVMPYALSSRDRRRTFSFPGLDSESALPLSPSSL